MGVNVCDQIQIFSYITGSLLNQGSNMSTTWELVLRTLLLLYSLAVAGFSDPVVGQLLTQNGTQSKLKLYNRITGRRHCSAGLRVNM